MSTHAHTVSGHFHLLLRLKGHAAAIRLFHAILSLTDPDWPYKPHGGSQLCETCMGVVYQNPRVTPEDIKAAAKQSGVHVKIKQLLPERVCKPSNTSFAPTRWIPNPLVHQLYGPHGVATVRAALEAEITRHLHPLTPRVPAIIPATAQVMDFVPDRTLINTVLDTPSERVM